MGVVETFCLNGEVGNITVSDDVVKVVLEYPNNERTWDELAYLFPIKRGLVTSRIFKAVNREYVPGRRRTERDDVGTPLLPGIDNREECHGCGKMVDVGKEAFYVKPGQPGEKEAVLCDACYMVPQPETIDAPPAKEGEGPGEPVVATCGVCVNFKPPEGEAEEGACAIHAGDPLAAYKKPGEIACEKFAAKPMPTEDEAGDSAGEDQEAAAEDAGETGDEDGRAEG